MKNALGMMIGRKLSSARVGAGGQSITFEFQDGHRQAFEVGAECCSRSWIEHLEAPRDLIGATLTGVKAFPIDHGDFDESMAYHLDYYKRERRDPQPDEDGWIDSSKDCVKFYQVAFSTDRGDIVIELRNASNGFYGASLSDAGTGIDGEGGK